MKVKELVEELKKFPDDMEVYTKKTDFCGNIGCTFYVIESTYIFFGVEYSCVLITDNSDEE